jgi:uncharacterized protein (DUF1800 family)
VKGAGTVTDLSRRDLARRLWRPARELAAASEEVRGPLSLVERAAAMRVPQPRRRAAKSVEAPPAAAVLALNRMAFGPRPGDIEAFNALGASGAQRLAAHVDQQLDPASINDAACSARIAAAGFTTINKSQSHLWQDHVVAGVDWYERMRPYFETERLTFLRAVHSRRQLVEVLADFWHNHFNVYGYDYWCGPLWVHYDRDVIRGHLLGNFRAMLGAVAKSPCMLYYLDNYTSSNAGPNENWSRELFELHTEGAENYLGVMRQVDVPLDDGGEPIGYVDDDVFEATRCFTGWTFSFDTGLFEYRGDWHDHFQKTILGTFLPANQPALKDGEDVLDAVAFHAGTARHIARKLCRRFISDDPPQNVVDDAAAVFQAAANDADQLAQVVRTILLAPEFLATWGEKVKRPFEVAVSALRAADAQFSFALAEDETDDLLWRYDQAGQPLFSWRAPDGYPDLREDWQSTTPRVHLWRLCNWLVDVEDAGGSHLLDAVGQTPAGVRSANELADHWIARVLGRPMPAADRQKIVDFMAQGYNPGLALPLDSDWDTQERLRAMVGLLFMSPSFLWR